MSMRDLEDAFNLLVEHSGESDFEGPKGMGLIVAAERRLGVEFPPTYRRFLHELGCGDVAGEEFYGIVGDDFDKSSIPNGVWVTLAMRKSGLPSSLIVIGAVGDGRVFALDTSTRDADGECPVVVWHVGLQSPQGPTRVAADFGEFFRLSIESALGD